MDPLQPRTEYRFDPFKEHPELDDVDINHLSGIDFTKNSDPLGIFSSRGLSPPTVASPAEVRLQSKQKATQIFRDFHLLHAVVERHEATIRRRWEKKSRAQRLKILLEAWPDMPASHRPEFAAFRKHPARLHDAAKDHYGWFMWPYINQEDLLKTKSLPLLLKARGRNQPSVFAAADGEATHLGRVSLVIKPVFLNCYTMVLNGCPPEDYGKLVGWEEHEDAFEWMASRRQFIPGEGLLILEAQARLLEFLNCSCRQILHEIPDEELVSDKYPIVPEPEQRSGNDTSILASLTTLAEEAPFRVPAKLDLDRVEALLAARVSRAEEHIWAMREDPGYFADQLIEMRDHRQEMLKDTQGATHPTLKPPREGIFWSRVISNVVIEAIMLLELFSKLHQQAQRLKYLKSKYASDISQRENLPEEYLVALLKFRHYLNQGAKGPMNQLKTTVAASPPMRAFFIREVPISQTSSSIGVISKPDSRMDKVTEHLLWLLRTLWEDDNDLFLCRLPVVVDELERTLQAEQTARDAISPHIAMLIGELSIIAECLRQLEMYQPWANGFENAFVERQEELKADFAKDMQSVAGIMEALDNKSLVKFFALGDPTDRKFDYPIDRRRNQANTDRLRQAEANLDIFWAKIDGLLSSRPGGLQGTALLQLLSRPWPLQRTPKWAEPAARAGRKKEDTESEPEAPTRPFSALFVGPESVSARKEVQIARGREKNKAKTRGRGAMQSVDEVVLAAEPKPNVAQSDAEKIFAVNARALKVFRILFFDPMANTHPGEVAWGDFLHAMGSVGFSARKLYGSVWQFQPTTLDVERSIQFHEPHPRGKIPFLIARRHGRRLSRAYGWVGRMFVLQTPGQS